MNLGVGITTKLNISDDLKLNAEETVEADGDQVAASATLFIDGA